MPRENIKPTKAVIANATARDHDYVIWETEVRGFGLRVSPSKRKSFISQYRIGRTSKKLTIGSVDLSLSVVRGLALEAAGKVAGGVDPGNSVMTSAIASP